MPDQTDFPEEWACESEYKRVRVDVLVRGETRQYGGRDDVITTTNWITIPTVNVEMHINKDGVADIQRSGKVVFPLEWAGASVLDILQNYGVIGDNRMTFARIYYYHEKSEQWILDHFGFVGGVGAASQRGTGKFWVYDLAELMDGVPANFRFVNPTFETVMEQVCDEMNTYTPAQLVEPLIIEPQTEEEIIKFVTQRRDEQSLKEDVAGGIVDALEETINTLTFGAVNIDGSDAIGQAVLGGYSYTVYEQVETGNVSDQTVKNVGESFSTQRVKTGITGPNSLLQIGSKSFKSNRDTLVDVMNWLGEKAGAKWHIEPTENGGRVILDILPTRRPFVQDRIVQEMRVDQGLENGVLTPKYANVQGVYDEVRVVDNNALYDINPINTVIVRGDFARKLGGDDFGLFEIPEADFSDYDVIDFVFPEGNKYPYVKASAQPLVDRAAVFSGSDERATMSTTVLETEDTTLGEAEASARKALKEVLSDAGEGEIVLYGNPKIMPYDKLTVYPTCSGNLLYTDVNPMTFEVEEVIHKKKSRDFYLTTLYVSVYVDDDDVTIEKKYVEANDE